MSENGRWNLRARKSSKLMKPPKTMGRNAKPLPSPRCLKSVEKTQETIYALFEDHWKIAPTRTYCCVHLTFYTNICVSCVMNDEYDSLSVMVSEIKYIKDLMTKIELKELSHIKLAIAAESAISVFTS